MAGSPLAGKKVLVTGGTGSIGSEIVRQILRQRPAVVRVFSRDETKQAELAEELDAGSRVRFLIGDVRDLERVRRALSGVDVVFHAAAMKHVKACEYNPFEAVQTNVIGTQNLILSALDADVGKVILVSTDKAVNPTTTMGASKLMAERVVSAANQWARGTVFASVRFGNVLGSRGSIVPIVGRIVTRGGVVSVPDPTMTRFVMSVSDAVRLVLEAAELAEGGETFILKMPAVAVIDLVEALAERTARRIGKRPGSVRIESRGADASVQGEKVYEELLTDEEVRRTEERGAFFVVYPAWRLPNPRAGRCPIDRTAYDSGVCAESRKLLSKADIKRLLDLAQV